MYSLKNCLDPTIELSELFFKRQIVLWWQFHGPTSKTQGLCHNAFNMTYHKLLMESFPSIDATNLKRSPILYGPSDMNAYSNLGPTVEAFPAVRPTPSWKPTLPGIWPEPILRNEICYFQNLEKIHKELCFLLCSRPCRCSNLSFSMEVSFDMPRTQDP